jgi:SAM-dependent methyltransferase
MSLPTHCQLCNANSTEQNVVTTHVYGDNDHERAFYHCQKCDVRYLYPVLSKEEEARFYAAEFEGFMNGRSGASGGWGDAERHIHANEKTYLRRMEYLVPHLSGNMSILEVGCSSGFMLFPLIDKSHSCIGIEPSGLFSNYLKDRGMVVYSSLDDLIARDSEIKFDLIQHYFVLEHITDPLIFLKTQLDLLNDGGKIIFEIPNAADPLCSVYDIPAFERFYWSIAHPWYFSEMSLSYLLEQLGQPFEIMLDQRYDLSNHMIWARDGKPGGMGHFTGLIGNDLEELYKKELIRNKRCDTLIAIITKN